MPTVIQNALGITADRIKTYALEAYAPAGFTGDPSQLLTLYLVFLPTEDVSTLASYIKQLNSPWYKGSIGIPGQLANLIIPSYPLLSVPPPSPGRDGSGGAGSGGGNGRRNAIIGVCAAFGGLALLILVWWCARAYRRSREHGHIQLDGSTQGEDDLHVVSAGGTSPRATTAARSHSSPSMLQLSPNGIERPVAAPVGGEDGRRRSFFYAEDELRGFDDGSRDEDMVYVHRQPSSGRRVPITPAAISAPILRESSLNW
ncbi:uncharacterized protein EI90DRAFT_3014945 [Cantharellus anzutake]|uniref:uncharacterized protein n=1 Tax=Cantharellus anzutake TaxID=1750568 RepID=UPI001903C030|nr:uncharacterized protein EI90DRAFT_3014945 [Cantharellus anzutake]KAF8334692.1 hypothetical protein EI90DRAFT_3014945 [Cantharellus anzutake]